MIERFVRFAHYLFCTMNLCLVVCFSRDKVLIATVSTVLSLYLICLSKFSPLRVSFLSVLVRVSLEKVSVQWTQYRGLFLRDFKKEVYSTILYLVLYFSGDLEDCGDILRGWRGVIQILQ